MNDFAPATAFHTAGDEWLAAYAAGVLSPLKRLLIECQAAMQPAMRGHLAALDCIGGSFLESAKGTPLSVDFAQRLSAAIDNAPPARERPAPQTKCAWMPGALQDFIDEAGLSVAWRSSGPGVDRAPLWEEAGERLYLLRARPSLKLPEHSHKGQEWTLILQGGYHIRETGYRRGDLHCENETCRHQPVIDNDGEECISLVADEGKLVFRDPILKMLQPLFGI